MGVGLGRFLQQPIGEPPLVVEGNSAFGFPGSWKSQGSAGVLDKFWGGWDLVFPGKALFLKCVSVPTCLIFPMKLI